MRAGLPFCGILDRVMLTNNGLRFLDERGHRGRGHANNHVGLEIDEVHGECTHLVSLAGAPTKFDAAVAAFRPAELLQLLLQRSNASLSFWISRRKSAQQRDPPGLRTELSNRVAPRPKLPHRQ